MNQSVHIFETSLGWIGVAWCGEALTRLYMPQSERSAIVARIGKSAPETEIVEAADIPSFVSEAIRQVSAYLNGADVDFSETPVEFGDVGPMRQAIYRVLRAIPHGRTLTYGELAAEAGYPGMAREIGQAMGQNPVPIIVPCHRVVAAGGKLGGFSAPGGARTKEKLLALENAQPMKSAASQANFGF